MTTQAGRNTLLRVMFAGQPVVDSWYIALYTDPAIEFIDYTSSRALWTPVSIYNELITGVTLTPIVPSAPATILGIGLHSSNVIGSVIDIKGYYEPLEDPIDILAGVPISIICRVGW